MSMFFDHPEVASLNHDLGSSGGPMLALSLYLSKVSYHLDRPRADLVLRSQKRRMICLTAIPLAVWSCGWPSWTLHKKRAGVRAAAISSRRAPLCEQSSLRYCSTCLILHIHTSTSLCI